MNALDELMVALNAVLWHDAVLVVVLATGILFTVWSRFGQYRALTHGVSVVRGVYDDPADPGAINHFQALSAALSATVGLGNIGGVALAISLGGPGAVLWMWVVGFFGMAVKMTEVTLSMLYRNTTDPDNPHGGPMWVVSKGLGRLSPALGGIGRVIGTVFCVTLLVSTATGGNMFQAWNVAELTQQYFGVPTVATGIVLAVLVGMVILGGIKRIGAVAGRLVPVMCALYLLAALYVLAVDYRQIPTLLQLILTSAFAPQEAQGAFIGGTAGYAFLFGMKRALFSNEAGQGSSPIAHSAAKTDEPVREGIVAGLEPFVDTLVVCTLTALVILVTGIWQRAPEASLPAPVSAVATAGGAWTLPEVTAPARANGSWSPGERVFVIVHADPNPRSGNSLHRLGGDIVAGPEGELRIRWDDLASADAPELAGSGVYVAYVGAILTAKAFDSVTPGLGKWLVTLAAWLFAYSTMISWSYYGEQGMVYLAGERSVHAYKLVYCLLIVVATAGLFRTDVQLDNMTGIGTGVMLFANIPIMWLFGSQAMLAYRDYLSRLRSGRMGPDHPPPSIEDLISGADVRTRGRER